MQTNKASTAEKLSQAIEQQAVAAIRRAPRPLWYDAARVRILLDYRPALRQRTGVGQYAHELASALQALMPPGDDLVLFSSSWKDRLPGDVIPGAGRVDARIPVSVLNAAWHRLEWPPIELLAGPTDIAHSLHPLLMPSRSARRVITIHDLDFLDHPERTTAEIRRDYPALAAGHAARADLVVVNSQHTAEAVRARLHVGDARLVVCRPGVPSDWAARTVPVGTGPILFVGTIEPRKNLPTLFRAYEQLLRDLPDVPPLLLAGRTVEQSAAILAPLEAAPLSGRVRHLGYVTDQRRRELYADASVLVLPSLDEGFGLTALEALHVGVPVVASNRGALPEVVGGAGVLVDPLDSGAMAAAIARLLADDGRRRATIEAGWKQAQQFTWRASARNLLEAYRRIVPARTAGRLC